MVFASPVFLYLFLPLALGLYYVGPKGMRALTLTLLSFAFYAWWRPDFVLLMLFSAGVDFAAGWLMDLSTSTRRRRILLVLSCATNLGLLAYFKYADFGIRSLNAILGSWGIESFPLLHVLLPVGISFYTFQSMSYTIDVYRKDVEAIRDPIAFLCYISMFPQLVAGPIVRYADVATQLKERSHTPAKFALGALFFEIGFAKKVLLADSVAPLAGDAFALMQPTCAEAWLGTVAYGFQIYFDFSGYSDMAIGLGLMFGFVFPINFDSPYLSRSLTDFWRRWHISLSTWLRDYLYIPMGGNRAGPRRTYAYLSITMLLGGLWHGAAWTFLIWGAWQGLWLVIERMNGRRPWYHAWPAALQVAVTFTIAMCGWVFFRAESLDQAWGFLSAMFGWGEGPWSSLARLRLDPLPIVALALCAMVTFGLKPSHRQVERSGWIVSLGTAVVFLLAVTHLFFESYRPFLYFQF